MEILYKDLCTYAKVLQPLCSETFLRKNNVRDHVTDMGRFVISHIMVGLPFNLPHVIFIHSIRSHENLDKDGVNFYFSSLVHKIIIMQGVLEHLLSPNILVPIKSNILMFGASHGQKFSINNVRQMQLEAKKLSKVPPLNIDKIINARKDKLIPPHMNLEKKKTLKVAGFANTMFVMKLELRSYRIIRDHEGKKLLELKKEKSIKAQTSPTSSSDQPSTNVQKMTT